MPILYIKLVVASLSISNYATKICVNFQIIVVLNGVLIVGSNALISGIYTFSILHQNSKSRSIF